MAHALSSQLKLIDKHSMKNKDSNSDRYNFAEMNSENETNKKEVSVPTFARGFAAMDEEKRRQVARRGGSVSRRNRMGPKEPIVIL